MKNFTDIIVDAGEGTLLSPRSSNKTGKTVNLVKVELDYSTFNSHFKLPPRLEKELAKARFAVPAENLRFIKHLLNIAPEHIYSPLYSGYDKMMKENLQSIGYEALHQAFHVLVDFLYDPTTQYYSRNKEFTAPVVEAMLMYKFLAGKVDMAKQREMAFRSWVFDKNLSSNMASQYHILAEVNNYEKIQCFVTPQSRFKSKDFDQPTQGNTRWNIYTAKIDTNLGKCTYSFAADDIEFVKRFVLNDFYNRYDKHNQVLTINDTEIELVCKNISDRFGVLEIQDDFKPVISDVPPMTKEELHQQLESIIGSSSNIDMKKVSQEICLKEKEDLSSMFKQDSNIKGYDPTNFSPIYEEEKIAGKAISPTDFFAPTGHLSHLLEQIKDLDPSKLSD